MALTCHYTSSSTQTHVLHANEAIGHCVHCNSAGSNIGCAPSKQEVEALLVSAMSQVPPLIARGHVKITVMLPLRRTADSILMSCCGSPVGIIRADAHLQR